MTNISIIPEHETMMANSLYLELSKNKVLWRSSLITALQKVTESISSAFSASRVSIWAMEDDNSLCCKNLYESLSQTHSQGLEIQREQYPSYFKALEEGRVIDASNARTDPRTYELRKIYLDPENICSMLDATLRTGGKAIGVVCIEQTEKIRQWSNQEKNIIQNLSDLISQIFVYHDLVKRASHDPLTGLPNRKSLDIELKKVMGDYDEKRIKFSLLLIDLDRFKDINDTLGHDYGDSLLKAIAPRIKEYLQKEDIFISRLGGDEFALLIRKKAGQKNTQLIAESIVNSLNEPFTVEGFNLQIAASIGMVSDAYKLKSKQDILRCADIAMYHAKNTDKNYAFYSPLIDNHSKDKLSLMADLRSAVANDEFILHYQPKIELQSNEVAGFEGLVRWNHPAKGLIYPDNFIDLIEMSDLVHSFTDYVLQMGIRQLREWLDKGIDLPISINISARNLLEHGLPSKIAEWLKLYDVKPSSLELEITERALITDPDRALLVVKKISLLGVNISIDDFGTGYSSLSYLKQLPINMLKIDRSFVLEMMSSKHDEIIVRSIISLAHNLGLDVVAEGVETLEIKNMLAFMGCDYVQGYVISYPLLPEDIKKYMSKLDNKIDNLLDLDDNVINNQ